MPSAAVHLTVAHMLKDKLNVSDDSSFYLGAISPDAVNLNGFAEENIRYAAHLRSKDYNEWKQNIKDYYISHRSDYSDSEDFFKGFLLHLYTDIAWDEVVQPGLFEHLKASGFSDAQLKDEKWAELDRIDSVIYHDERYKEVLKRLAKAKGKAISTVDALQLEKFRDAVSAETCPVTSDKPVFLTCQSIQAAADKAFEYMQHLTNDR